MSYAIEVTDLWKKYRLYHDRTPTLKEKILFRNRNRYEDLWVLRNINLKVEPGRTIGLIGQNGSGKSTLLKLLSRIINPDRGRLYMDGKVSSLLELGAGFHPDFSGIENIYMNAAVFGMNRKEIEKKLDYIIDFSELGDFIYSPVRTYSSGMYMRLAFSVAINVNPDILLIDEILSVGDESFQKKCFARMESNKAEAITTVIVSHDLSSLERLCDQVVWIHESRILKTGNPIEVTQEYRTVMAENDNLRISNENEKSMSLEEVINNDPAQSDRWGNRAVEIVNVSFSDCQGNPRFTFKCGEPAIIEMDILSHQAVNDLVFGVGIFRPDNICCYGTNTYIDRYKVEEVAAGQRLTARFYINHLNLIPGEYSLDVAVHDSFGTPFDYQTRRLKISLYSDIKDTGVCRLDHQWTILKR